MAVSLSAQKSLQRDSEVCSVHYHLPYLGQSMQEILDSFAGSRKENPAASHLFIQLICIATNLTYMTSSDLQ